jgi:hypothetical protein
MRLSEGRNHSLNCHLPLVGSIQCFACAIINRTPCALTDAPAIFTRCTMDPPPNGADDKEMTHGGAGQLRQP